MRSLPLLLLAIAIQGCPPAPVCPNRNDDTETPEEAAMTKQGKDACARAADKLTTLKCKEARPDFAVFCRHTIAEGQPLCATKLSRIKDCGEIEGICR